jgi:hypothetical protein
VTSELNAGPNGAPVAQSRSVTCTVHVPTRLARSVTVVDSAPVRTLAAATNAAVRHAIATARAVPVCFEVFCVMSVPPEDGRRSSAMLALDIEALC